MTAAVLDGHFGPAADAADASSLTLNSLRRSSLSPAYEIPDLTGGLGTAGYDFSQAIAAAILKAIMNNINLMALARAAGLDPVTFLKHCPRTHSVASLTPSHLISHRC